jgi:hypothetical protein
VVRTFVSIVAGFSQVPPLLFGVLSLIGTAVWVTGPGPAVPGPARRPARGCRRSAVYAPSAGHVRRAACRSPPGAAADVGLTGRRGAGSPR